MLKVVQVTTQINYYGKSIKYSSTTNSQVVKSYQLDESKINGGFLL